MKKNINLKNFKTLLFLIFIVIFFILIILIFNIKFNDKFIKKDNGVKNEKIKIGLIVGYGGFGDKSFNDMQYNGIVKAKNLFPQIEISYYAPLNKNDIENKIIEFIKNGVKYIIIGEGYYGKDIIIKLAPIFENVNFILLDNKFDNYLKNMSSVLFKQNEVSFLTGALAAYFTKNKSLLFFGGMKLDVIDDFYIGFEQGINYVSKNEGKEIKIYKEYFSDYISEEKVWDSPDEAYKLINNLYKKYKFDIVYAVAAGTNLGVFRACKELSIFSIGVDSDQDYLLPGVVLTSAMKRLDNAIVKIVQKIVNNDLKNINYDFGLKEGGGSLTNFNFTRDIIGDEVISKIKEIEQKIIDGEIKVGSIFK